MYDLGDPVPLGIDVADAAGAPANAVTVALTITLPDGTSVSPVVTNPPAVTGSYTYDYATVQAGRHTVRWVTTTPTGAYTDTFDVDESAPTGIVSLDDVKAHLNITTTDQDEELRRFIDAATDFIEGRIGPVVRRTIVEPVTPDGSGVLWLSGPVISLTTITAARGYSATYDVANYTAEGSAVIPNYAYPTTSWPVTVTYVGGRVVVPALVRQAALDYVKWLYLSQRGPTPPPPGAFGADEFEVSAPATVPFRILQALEPYISPVVA